MITRALTLCESCRHKRGDLEIIDRPPAAAERRTRHWCVLEVDGFPWRYVCEDYEMNHRGGPR